MAIAQEYFDKVTAKFGEDRVEMRRKDSYPAYVQWHTDGSILMAVPVPDTLHKLNTFLHECCHALMGHTGESQSKAEYEATRCASETMRNKGIDPASDEWDYDLGSVIGGIIDDINAGVEPDRRAVAMAREADGEPYGKYAAALKKYEKERGHALI